MRVGAHVDDTRDMLADVYHLTEGIFIDGNYFFSF
jgi:hypothetical protein